MILTAATLVHYLVDRGLVAPETVVDGDYSAREMSRRNRNFRVRRGALPGLFVKQPSDWEPFSTETLRREATCYLLARDDPDFAALAEMMPRFVDFDAPRFVLTVELLEGETLAEHHLRTGHFSAEVGERLGALLGRYHRHAGARARDAAQDAAFPRGIPWILNVMHHNPARVGPVSAGVRAVVEMLGRYPEFGAALDAVRDGWRRDALVHGDLKWENCLLLARGPEDALPELRIVDWELADFGDACWDVGSVFQAYLASWLLSIHDTAGVDPARLAELAHFPLERMHPGIHAFWGAYAGTLGLDGPARAERLRRAILFAAARLIQTAWEHTTNVEHVPTNVLYLMQVAMNVLTRPDDAVRHLLGFDERLAA